MEDTISVKEILAILKKRWWFIVLCTLGAAILSGVFSIYVLTPKYEASTQILVNQKDPSSPLDASQMRSNVELINTYSVIINSSAILGKVIEKLDLDQTVGELNQNIEVNIKSESQVFSLTVRDNSPESAVGIANAISETFQQEIKSIMNVDNVNILARAELNKNPVPVSPKPTLNIAVGIVVGLMFGIGVVFFLEFMDNSIKSSEDVERYLDLPVLGSTHKLSKQKIRKSLIVNAKGGEPLESRIKS